ncbi:MAG: hypothetical protein MK089_11200 [Phycisphaerales bacterium]|nr:hypothetical protein [Phycisphaerales bacterium]
MKIATETLKKLTGILEGDLPTTRQGLQTMADKLKDQILVMINQELDKRKRG